MDQQLLDALNNLSIGLEKIADALESSTEAKSDVGTALQGGNFGEQIREINNGIISIKNDTSKILDNQQTIIKLQKQKSKEKSLFGTGETSGEKIKDGVTNILLIAGAVLSIGAAFKLVGQVDFASVVALSVTLPMMAYSFEKLAKLEIDYGQMLSLFGVVTMMSLSLVASSYILSGVASVSPTQILTIIGIAGAFGLVSYSISNLVSGFKDINVNDAIKAGFLMPIVLLAVSASIAASSYLLAQTVPIGLSQAFSVIVIAGAFGAVSYGLGQLIDGFKGISPAQALLASVLMPVVLVGISYAIVASSKILKDVEWIGLGGAISSILVAGVFFAISYAIKPLMKGIQGVKVTDMFKGTAMMVMMSGAILASSLLIAQMPSLNLVNILLFGAVGLAVSVTTAIMLMALSPIKKMAITDMLKGTAMVVLVAGAVVLSSHVIATMSPIGMSGIFSFTALSIGLAISSFVMGLAMVGLAKIGNIKDFVMGGLAVITIAGAISISSLILNIGKYENYPSFKWTLETGASILIFGIFTLALGALITLTGGMGAVALLSGAAALIGLSGVIVAVDAILAIGKYQKAPNMDWIKGVGLSLLIFGGAALAVGALFLATFGIGAAAMAAGSLAILGISKMILETDTILAQGQYMHYPSLTWLQGSTGALRTYINMMSEMGIGTMAKQLLGKITGGITGIAKSILVTDKLFSAGKFTTYPSVDWVNGSIKTLSKFANLSNITSFKDIIKGKMKDLISGGIAKIASNVVEIDKIFSKGDFSKYPSVAWIDGTISMLAKYSEMVKLMKDTFKGKIENIDPLKTMASSITSLAMAFDKLANSFTKFNRSVSDIDNDKLASIKTMSSNIVLLSLMDPDQFNSVMDGLEERSGVLGQLVEDFKAQKVDSNTGGSAIQLAPTTTGHSEELKELSMKFDQMTAIMADISTVVGSRGALKSYLNNIRENQLDDNTYRSDKRLKNIISKVGVSDNGINIYDFTYIMDRKQERVYRGVIAQELLDSEWSDAVSESNGFWCVDYSKIDVDFYQVETI